MKNSIVETTREMLSAVKEVGGMPFALFQYYLTCIDEEGRIRPSLPQIADDLGLTKPAICNLRAKLIAAQWVELDGEEVFIRKSFTKNEQPGENHSQKMNDAPESFTKNECRSQKMNESFTKNEQDSQKMNDLEELFTKNEQNSENRSQKMNENDAHIRNIKDHLHQDNNLNGGGGVLNAHPREPTDVITLTELEKKMSKEDFQKKLKVDFSHLEDVDKSIGECVEWFKRTKGKPPNRLQVKKWLTDEYEDFDLEIKKSDSPEDRRKLIDKCNLCDANGYIKIGDGVKICKHEKTNSGAKT